MLRILAQRVVVRPCSPCRKFATAPDNLELPPLAQWRTQFPFNTVVTRDAVTIKNADMADEIATAFLKATPGHSGEGKVVIEAFPVEPLPHFLKYLKPLEELDSRVTVLPLSGHVWDTYSNIEERGLLQDVQSVPWESGTSDLQFIAQLPHTVSGEQLISQLCRTVPERSWLFQYGRVPMSFITSQQIWNRLTSPMGSRLRCKLGVIAELSCEITAAVDSRRLGPWDDCFYPPARKSSKTMGKPMHAFTSIPYVDQIITPGAMEEWDYVLRRLFVTRNTLLKDALNSLAPGASSLVSTLTDTMLPRHERVNVTKNISELNASDWALILRAFHNWPFKPQLHLQYTHPELIHYYGWVI
ncbi:S-adenosyl-L-methionine-dependent methyltransferase [Epithele typhae]|uniref:S-adenosyl-L-methionine-dependent methyltransferase n=1 Tax=Epithele typhae TaxID=378194 RepID=UPI00200796DE|nr:S-adenosyl-L-methionine-dependent methyltransferase [Epithele typhae]KAH9942277.1 S-adenosyl-L-methionine-dependent methyltransferase [Epithele typhae]